MMKGTANNAGLINAEQNDLCVLLQCDLEGKEKVFYIHEPDESQWVCHRAHV